MTQPGRHTSKTRGSNRGPHTLEANAAQRGVTCLPRMHDREPDKGRANGQDGLTVCIEAWELAATDGTPARAMAQAVRQTCSMAQMAAKHTTRQIPTCSRGQGGCASDTCIGSRGESSKLLDRSGLRARPAAPQPQGTTRIGACGPARAPRRCKDQLCAGARRAAAH